VRLVTNHRMLGYLKAGNLSRSAGLAKKASQVSRSRRRLKTRQHPRKASMEYRFPITTGSLHERLLSLPKRFFHALFRRNLHCGDGR
jgi:hypothetical protein